MITKARNLSACHFGNLQDRKACLKFNFNTVNYGLGHGLLNSLNLGLKG